MKYLLLSVFIILLLHSCILPINTGNSAKKSLENKYALKEDFVQNKIGWIEEKSDQHELEIKNGYYFIHSIDTSFLYTSTSPLDKSFLYGLRNFELETAIQLVKKSPKSTQFGVFFVSGILQYDFMLDFDGHAKVTEYNHGNQCEKTIIDKEIIGFSHQSINSFKIEIIDSKFSFSIDNKIIGNGEINSRSWQEMRMYVSSGTDIMMNSFNIQKK